MFDNCCFMSNLIQVEHPNFLGCQTTVLQFEFLNKVESNIPHVPFDCTSIILPF